MQSQKKSLSAREHLFCGYYTELQNPEEAARRAGYKSRPDLRGMRLLLREDIQAELLRLAARRRYADEALAGLARLALGRTNDVLRLAFDDTDASASLDTLDLFAVAELKRPKGGGCEIKLHDRQKALALLLDCAGGDDDGVSPLLEALDRGVQAAAAADDDHAL